MITRMYGHCDEFDVVYTQINTLQWQAVVPPDLEDGKYVTDIYAVDDTGCIVYWAGILYMYDSKHIKLEILPDSCVIYRTDNITITDVYMPSNHHHFYTMQQYEFILLNREEHVSWGAVGYQN